MLETHLTAVHEYQVIRKYYWFFLLFDIVHDLGHGGGVIMFWDLTLVAMAPITKSNPHGAGWFSLGCPIGRLCVPKLSP